MELDGGEPKSAACRLTQHFFTPLYCRRAEVGDWGDGEGGGWLGDDQRGRDRQTGRQAGGVIERR